MQLLIFEDVQSLPCWPKPPASQVLQDAQIRADIYLPNLLVGHDTSSCCTTPWGCSDHDSPLTPGEQHVQADFSGTFAQQRRSVAAPAVQHAVVQTCKAMVLVHEDMYASGGVHSSQYTLLMAPAHCLPAAEPLLCSQELAVW